MNFFDGLLIRKAMSVEDVLFEKIQQNPSAVRPYTERQIRAILQDAKSKLRDADITLDATEPERHVKRERATTTTGNQVMKINDAVILGAIRQVQSYLPEDLVSKLVDFLTPKSKSEFKDMPMDRPQELVLEQLMDVIAKRNHLSETLQNKLYDNGLLELKFLLMLDEMAKTGVRKVHPNLYKRLMRQKERPENTPPSPEYAGFEPTELFENVIQKLEELAGTTRPDKESILREYRLLRDQRKLSVVDVVRLVNTDKYRFQGKQTKNDLSNITEKINDMLRESWDEIIGRFIRDIEITDANGETRTDRSWSTANIDNELVAEWERIKENPKVSFEKIRGKKYQDEIAKLEQEYFRISKHFKAARRIIQMLQEKTFISDDVNYNLEQREQEFHNQYKMIKESVKDFEKYKKAFHRELKDKKKKQQQLEARLRRKRDADKPGVKPEKEDTAEVDDFMEQVAAQRKKTEPTRITPGMNIEELRAKVKELNERYEK